MQRCQTGDIYRWSWRLLSVLSGRWPHYVSIVVVIGRHFLRLVWSQQEQQWRRRRQKEKAKRRKESRRRRIAQQPDAQQTITTSTTDGLNITNKLSWFNGHRTTTKKKTFIFFFFEFQIFRAKNMRGKKNSRILILTAKFPFFFFFKKTKNGDRTPF